MQCVASRPFSSADLLTDRTLAVQHLVGQRSLLPPAPSAEQLLQLLREAGHPSATMPPNESGGGAASGVLPPAEAFTPDHILRQCPTSRRVTSSFAAAGAHSLLGEMLQLFAESLTRLFTAGVADPAVCAFPSEWERRLHAPAAAALRQHHLYELQGFSALYTFAWAQVATSLSLAREQVAEPSAESPAAAALRSASAGRTAARGTTPKAARAAPLAVANLPPLPATPPTQRLRQPPPPLLVPVPHSSPAKQRFIGASAGARYCVPMTSADLHLPVTDGVASAPLRRGKSATLTEMWTRPAAPPPALAVLQHALTAQAKLQGRFLPSIPAEGIIPSSAIRDSAAPAPEGTVGSGSSGGTPPSATLPSASSSARAARPSPAMSVEQAIQQDRQRELQRTLGVRRVRNYAEESDMRGYLDDYQTSLQSVLDEGGEFNASPPAHTR